MYKKGTGNDKQRKDTGNRMLCPYSNFSQAIKGGNFIQVIITFAVLQSLLMHSSSSKAPQLTSFYSVKPWSNELLVKPIVCQFGPRLSNICLMFDKRYLLITRINCF